jgi:membrane-bound lytic murein transglycosylase A
MDRIMQISKRLVRFVGFSFVFAVIAGVTGCQRKVVSEPDYDRQLSPGQKALRKITDPGKIPDITIACYNLDDLEEAVGRSINYMSKPSSTEFFPMSGITHAKVMASLVELERMLAGGMRGSELKQTILRKFDFYTSVGWDGNGGVLFTGYYTPIFDGSLKRTAKYKYPLYSQPDDLVKGPRGEILGRRLPSGKVVPYPTRKEIENSNMLAGDEIAWLESPFEAYIAHVQGSAKIRLDSGEMVTLGYAANNGHEYRSVSRLMVQSGAIPSHKLSLSAMIDYFKVHPAKIEEFTNQNPRYVFFQVSEGPPRGSLNEPVTAMRSIATDKDIYPRASLTFVSAELPRIVGGRMFTGLYTGFFLDQDTGGAIRAPGRCDVYMGIGEQAGRLAGQTYREGRLYYIFLKDRYLTGSATGIVKN